MCCGFANENPQLKIGTVRNSFGELMRNAAERPQVRACYETGLGAVRERLEREGVRFPGKTGDVCFFCDYLCKEGLVE
ncbi:MAG: hypothetical protein CVV47_14555 [Spirochaetae bacterium HGW-Spirochaetae-3]|nr:MAG: hypothetical protein CVV47_14555 [Spirochaetae bacterium HGW-Spirochaetae-3]